MGMKSIVNQMGSEDLVVERRKGLFQSEQELEEWGIYDKEYNRQRQVKVNVEKILQGTSYRC
jgi:hypothetical protein